ncbi:MAG: hypothetical protein ACLRFE_02775 [Clostridia bacterium]
MYIDNLSRKDFGLFFIRIINRLYNKDFSYSIYILDTNPKMSKIKLIANSVNSSKEFIIAYNDFELKIVDTQSNNEVSYAKEWAQYVCDTLADKAVLKGNEFSAIEYKKAYNAYWQNNKRERIAQIEQECVEKLFK